MGRLIFWVFFVVALYSGYWFVGARAIEQGLTTSIADARQDGWQIDYSALAVTGFPGQFDLRTVEVDMVAADGKWAWRVPSAQVSAPSIQPTHLNVSFPQTQTLRLGDQTLRIESADMQIGAGTKLNTALTFEAAMIEISAATVQSDFGWQVGLDRAHATATFEPDTVASYVLDVDAANLTLPAQLVAQIAPDAALSNTITSIVLDSTVTLDRPLDRFALDGSTSPPVIDKISLTALDLMWGDIDLNAEGSLDIDPQGIPDGRITFRTAQWQALIDVLVAVRVIDTSIVPTLSNMAAAMASDDGVLELPVTFRDGFMSMGLLPLGPAPRLR
jgi:hypothetical protein